MSGLFCVFTKRKVPLKMCYNKVHDNIRYYYVCTRKKIYHSNGELQEHYYIQGKRHGEYKIFYDNGELREHYFCDQGSQIDLSSVLEDPLNPTETDKITLSLMFGSNYMHSIT